MSGAPVLVTGASGFLGRHVLAALARRGHARPQVLVRDPVAWAAEPWSAAHEVTPVEGSVEVPGWSAGLAQPRAILHLAGVVRHSRRDPGDRMREINVEGTLAAVRAAAEHGCRLVVVSTSGTVGCSPDPAHRPDEGAPHCAHEVGRWPYYASKIELEQRAGALAQSLGVELVIVRPPVLLGPGDHRLRSTSNVLRFLRGALPFLIRGGIHYADVRDVADALVELVERPRVRPTYHLPGTACGIESFFADVSRVSGVPVPRFVLPFLPAWLLARALAPLHVLPDPVVVEMAARHWGLGSRYCQELGYKPRDPLETLADTVRWLRAHAPALRPSDGNAATS